jgi:hypothetical protein
MGGIAPGTVLSPMPGSHPKLSVVAITDGPPAGRERFLNDMRRKNVVDIFTRKDVDGTPQSAVRVEGVQNMAGSDIHVDGRNIGRSLSEGNAPTKHQQRCKEESRQV